MGLGCYFSWKIESGRSVEIGGRSLFLFGRMCLLKRPLILGVRDLVRVDLEAK